MSHLEFESAEVFDRADLSPFPGPSVAMFYRIWVARGAKFISPLRCCCCGSEDPDDVLHVVARYRHKSWASILRRHELDLPVCYSCRMRNQFATWMVPAVMILGIIFGLATFWIIRHVFPNMDEKVACAFAILLPTAVAIAFAAILFPTQVSAGFDNEWLVLEIRNREFAKAFYECNRDVAHMDT